MKTDVYQPDPEYRLEEDDGRLYAVRVCRVPARGIVQDVYVRLVNKDAKPGTRWMGTKIAADQLYDRKMARPWLK